MVAPINEQRFTLLANTSGVPYGVFENGRSD